MKLFGNPRLLRGLVICSVAFAVGFLGAPAFAVSHATPYKKIFGHSTSCALHATSINDTTNKVGSRVVNRVGCHVNNAPQSVPALRMDTGVEMMRVVNGQAIYYCSISAGKINTSPATEIVITANLTVNSACPLGGKYRSHGLGSRKSDAGKWYSLFQEKGDYTLN